MYFDFTSTNQRFLKSSQKQKHRIRPKWTKSSDAIDICWKMMIDTCWKSLLGHLDVSVREDEGGIQYSKSFYREGTGTSY